MATSNRLVTDLRNHPELQPFLLRNVTFTGETIGCGSYGSVDEVAIPGALCAAKKIHDVLSQEDSKWMAKETVDENVRKFVEECKMMSRLRHPNIVQFLGVFFPPGSSLPLLVMEKLLMSLHSLLDPDEPKPTKSYIPLSLKCSILRDIARGIAYLHSQSPPVAHRDLSARNVLLNEAMVAKIADLGMARIVPSRKPATMTKAPGASIYMPPEALEDKSKYDVSIDMFSFGVLAMFVLAQQFPHELKAPNYVDEAKGSLVARSELERRVEYMENVYSKFPKSHPLIQMIEQCLKNSSKARPTIDQALELIKQAEAPAIQGFSILRLNKLQFMQVIEQKEAQLELESMQQKCDAWREEVEELTPLRDEVAHLHQENARLQQEVARASEDNAGLGRQLQEMSSARRQVGELERKAAEYDQLMDRVTELQHVRVELENELGPLRDEHTATLPENANFQQQLQEHEEVEELTPLRDEVAHLQQENTRVARASEVVSMNKLEKRRPFTDEVVLSKQQNTNLKNPLKAEGVAKEEAPSLTAPADEGGVASSASVRARGSDMCPLCSAVVESGDGLQLHFLTSCPGYDKVPSLTAPADEGGVASSASAHVAPPTAGVAPSDHCQVQFMWQPLTKMSYAKVTLLSSFEPGSINLTLDRDGGHYYSDQLSIPSGSYDGQLVVGDSFIHPVKKFTVSAESGGVVLLEFEIVAGGGSESHGSGTGEEGDAEGDMQPNPSFNQAYNTGGSGYMGGEGGGGYGGYKDRDYQNRGKTETSGGGDSGVEPRKRTSTGSTSSPHSSRVYSSYESGQFDSVDTSSVTAMRKLQLQHNDPLQHRELSASPVEPYSPDAYSDTRSTHSTRSGMEPRKSAKRTSTGSTSSPHTGGVGKQLRSSSSSLGSTGIMTAHVTMRDGVAREVMIQRPLYKLNPKQIPKPEVIVKRKGGTYETGFLAYVGDLDGKEMAGVMLDLPSGPSDGTFKDGKTYFRCNPGHGLYCPLSNIFVEADSMSV